MDVTFRGLEFRRSGRVVLALPGLTLASGRVTAVLGPNGSGKTTMLRLIAALERPDAGAVLLGGRPATPDRETREAIAYAFQQAAFLTGTVRSNLDLALRLRSLSAAERAARIEQAAAACGIGHLLHRNAHRVSGGEGQRANLARALCLRAPITLLDEPLHGLDRGTREALLAELPGMLRTFASTTILVTHERDEAMRLGDDLVVLIDGRLRAHGEKGEVFRAPPDREVAAFLGYTVLGDAAIRPGALRVGRGDFEVVMRVEGVGDMGTHLEAWGRAGETQLRAMVDGERPAPYDEVTVSAPASAVVRFPGAGATSNR
jgi:ABC-type sugar transport system ATPase subunit